MDRTRLLVTQRKLWPWLIGLMLAYSVVHFAVSGIWTAFHEAGGDLLSAFPGPLIRGREAWGRGLEGYVAAVRYPWPIWNYGPIAQFWTYPLGFTRSVPASMLILLIVNYALLATAFLIWLSDLSTGRSRRLVLAVMLVVWLNYFPLYQAIFGREIEILEFFLLSVAFYLLQRGRDASAGSLIGLAAMTKFLPALFIPYLFIKRRWRAAWASTITVVLIAIVGQLALGFEHSMTFQVGREWADSQVFRPHADNQAMINVVQRLFVTGIDPREPKVTPAFPRLSQVAGNMLQTLVLGLVFLALWKRRKRPITLWEYSLLLMTMILVPPWANVYYLMFLVIPFSAAFVWLLGGGEGSRHWLGAVAIAYLLSGYVVPRSLMAAALSLEGVELRWLLGHLSLPGIGMLILFASFWALERFSSRPEEVPS